MGQAVSAIVCHTTRKKKKKSDPYLTPHTHNQTPKD